MSRHPRGALRACKNPECREPLGAYRRVPLCPSCRLMGRWASAAAFGVVLVARLVVLAVEWLS